MILMKLVEAKILLPMTQNEDKKKTNSEYTLFFSILTGKSIDTKLIIKIFW